MIQLFALFGVTVVAFAVVIGLMAVGVILGRRAIQGSCGGLGSGQGEEGASACSLCSNPDAACRELARRGIQAGRTADFAGQEEECDLQCEANGCSQEEIEACNRG